VERTSPRLRAVPPSVPADAVRDEDLLLAVARGDQAAFEALYDRLAPLVHGIVRRVVRDPSQSEEVTQEVLLEIWRTAVRFDPDRGAVRSWAATMAHRRAVDRVRSEQAARVRTEKVGIRDQVRDHDEVSETVERRLEYQQVREALSALTDLQREAVELAYFQGYTYRQAAELLGTPLGTIKTRMRDGLIRLRDELGVSV
jgi:RNA polymerase sigma-70 factor, ECF subfamily